MRNTGHTTGTPPEHLQNTSVIPPEHRTPTEHKTTGKAEKPAYIGKFADNEKKVKKSQKKIGNTEKGCNFATAIKSNNVMKVLKSTSLQMKVKRSYDFSSQWAKVIVTECKTIYLVSIIVIGYELPSVAEWRISKKDAKDAFEAANIVAYKAYLRGEL